MPLRDWTDYYLGVINSGRHQLDTIEDAHQSVLELIDLLEATAEFNKDQIDIYSATVDHIEGFLLLRPDDLTSAIDEVASDAFYIKAILKKFPDLKSDFTERHVDNIIDACEKAQKVIDGISGDDPGEHLKWKQEILDHLRDVIINVTKIG